MQFPLEFCHNQYCYLIKRCGQKVVAQEVLHNLAYVSARCKIPEQRKRKKFTNRCSIWPFHSVSTLGINKKVIQYIIQNIKQPKYNLTADSHKMHLCFD